MDMQEGLLQLIARFEHAILILGILTSVLVLCFLSLALILGMLVWQRSQNQGIRFDSDRAKLLFEQGKFSALLEFSERYAKRYPYCVQAHWYIGLARFTCGDFSQALWAFDRVRSINPSWQQEVSAYLKAIQKQTSVSASSLHARAN